MVVKVDVEKIGSYHKNADRTTIPGGLPPRLNESKHLYGELENELDLTLGFKGYKDEGFGDRFHSLFDYIKKTNQPGLSMKKAIDADFVSNRRNLQVMAQSPYSLIPMEIQAFRQNGVIFLCDKAKPHPDRGELPYGYKFEQYMTLNEDGRPRSKYEKVSNAECAKNVLRTTVTSGNESIKVLYAAEMDAIDGDNNFVELKTTSLKHFKWLERQSLANYLQSYLGGVPYIVYGRKTDRVWTKEIPNYEVNWKKDVCFEQLFRVLDKIKSKLEYDEEALLMKVTKEGIFFEPECSNRCTFMDQDFLNHFE